MNIKNVEKKKKKMTNKKNPFWELFFFFCLNTQTTTTHARVCADNRIEIGQQDREGWAENKMTNIFSSSKLCFLCIFVLFFF